MPIRNPFKKAQTAQEIFEQNNRDRISADKGFEEANVQGSKPVDIKEPVEYKLSSKMPRNAVRGGYPTFCADMTDTDRHADNAQTSIPMVSLYR